MDLPSSTIDSFVSAVSGMDRKGVPAKGSEDTIKTSHSFENELRRHDVDKSSQERPAPKKETAEKDIDRQAKSEDSKSKKESSNTSESESKSSNNEQIEGQAKENRATIADHTDVDVLPEEVVLAEEVLVEEGDLKEDEEVKTVVDASFVNACVEGQPSKEIQVVSEESLEKNKTPNVTSESDEQILVLKDENAKAQVVEQVQIENKEAQVHVVSKGERSQVNAELAKQQLAQISHKDLSQKNAKAELKHVDPEVEEALKQMETLKEVKPMAKSDLSLMSDSKNSVFDQELTDYEEGQLNLKQLANKLWLHKNLAGERADFVKTKLDGVEKPQFQMVQKNLVEDVRPLLQKVSETKEGGQMTVTLRPGNLGRVKVDVQVQNNQVKVELHAEKAATQHFMKDQVVDLKKSLQSMGLKVEEVSISQLRPEQTHQEKDSHNQQQKHNQDSKHQSHQEGRQEGRDQEESRQGRRNAREPFADTFEKEVA